MNKHWVDDDQHNTTLTLARVWSLRHASFTPAFLLWVQFTPCSFHPLPLAVHTYVYIGAWLWTWIALVRWTLPYLGTD